MFGKKIIIKQEKDKTVDKKVYSFDYFKSTDKNSTRFDLFNYFMKEKNTIIHINTNMTSSISSDRENAIKFKEMCEKDNLNLYISPTARENNGGFLGQFINKNEKKTPAYNILIFIPAGIFSKYIFDRYLCTYYFRAGIGFNSGDYSKIKSDFETGLLTPEDFYKFFEYDIFDAFEFSHIKIISDLLLINELQNTFS